MIVNTNINEAILLTIGVTDQMARDMRECRRKLDAEEDVSCKGCSWERLNCIGDGYEIDPCGLQEVRQTILGDKCRGCFGAANGDCDNCTENKAFSGCKIGKDGKTMLFINQSRQYTINQIIHAIEQTDREIVIALMRRDEQMLKDVLQRFLH